MKSLQILIHQHKEKLLAIIGALCVLLPTSPLNMQYTHRDSGVFLYVGWRILNGELPYRDVWDHKPPVIFYINALGLAMTGGSRWGVWLLELLSLSFAIFIGYKIIKETLGFIPSIFSTFLWLLTLISVINGGNLTTEYTLPLQFATLWLAATAIGKPTFSYWRWFWIGLLGAVAFFTKQNTIGIWIAVMLFSAIYRVGLRQTRELVIEFVYFLTGTAIVCIGWIAFFALQGGLSEFYSAFMYNFTYSSLTTDFLDRLKPVTVGMMPLTRTGLLQLAGIGYVIGLLLVLYRRKVIREWLPLLGIGLIDFPIELILVSISGRTYAHYYMTILPILAFLAGVTFWAIRPTQPLLRLFAPHVAKYALSVGALGVLTWTSLYFVEVYGFHRASVEFSPVIMEIERRTDPKDKVLVWGNEVLINYYSRRQSPTRFVYQYPPLYTPGYVNEQIIVKFLDDLINKRPRLIIDTHRPTAPLYKFPIETDAIRQRIAYLQCRYHKVAEVQGLDIYEYAVRDCAL